MPKELPEAQRDAVLLLIEQRVFAKVPGNPPRPATWNVLKARKAVRAELTEFAAEVIEALAIVAEGGD